MDRKPSDPDVILSNSAFTATVLDTVEALVIALDARGTIVCFNKACERITGYTREEALGSKVWDFLLLPEEKEGVSAVFQSLLTGNFPNNHENIWLTKNGEQRVISWSNSVTVNAKGDIDLVIATGVDITEQKETFQELNRFQAIAEASPNVIVITRLSDGKIAYANPATYSVSGYRPEEIIGEVAPDFYLNPDERASYVEVLKVDGEAKDFEVQLKRKDGTPFLSRANSKILMLDGELHIVGELEDVTAHRELQKRLFESEKKYRTIFETSKVGLSLCKMDGSLIECNQAYLDIIGYTKDEAQALTYWDLTPGEYEEDESRQLKSLEETGFYGPFEKHYIKKSGDWVPVLLNGAIIHGGDNQGYIWSFIQDLTQYRRQQAELRAALERAQQSDKAKSEFLSSMSHELRTPMNAILGFSQLLKASIYGDLNKKQLEALDHIVSSGDHLLNLINQVLDLSRIESGELSINMESVDIQNLVDEVMAIAVPLAASRDIQVNDPVLDLNGGKISVHADPLRLKQAVINLVGNAVKYNRDGGSISLSCEMNGEAVVLSVHDTGWGIPLEKQDKLFQPFERLAVEKFSDVEGAGIGLSITKELVRAMGGEIGFESEVDIGSTFWVSIPISDVHVDENNPEQSLLGIQGGKIEVKEGSIQGKKILYVEDNLVNLKLMGKVLGNIGNCELITATTAEEGIEIALGKSPDIILMDINLPGMSGLDAIKALVKNPKTASIPIIAVSANAMPEDIENVLDAGAQNYVTKPFNIQDVMDAIAAAVVKRA